MDGWVGEGWWIWGTMKRSIRGDNDMGRKEKKRKEKGLNFRNS